MRTIHREGQWRIAIGSREHGIPHFHVIFSNGIACAVSIEHSKVIAGKVLPKKVAEAIEWAGRHQDLLMQVWKEMNP